MADLVFYTNPMSRGRIGRWMMEEAGLPYETRIVPYGPEMKAPEYRALNPMGKVPTLLHGVTVITEVAAICAYMADLAGKAHLAPSLDDPDRGAYYRWLFFAAGPVEAAVTAKSFGFDTEDAAGYQRAGWGNLEAVADTLSQTLADGRQWWLGDRFSAVDVYLGSQISWGIRFGSLPDRPGFADYAARLAARPAAIRAAEIDDALIAEARKDGA
jgi:glutathione S-transferase